MLTCKRRRIDNAKKLEIIDLAAEKGVNHAINVARNTVGYERLTDSLAAIEVAQEYLQAEEEGRTADMFGRLLARCAKQPDVRQHREG